MISKIIKLNIGGTRFSTTMETLCRHGQNFFAALLNENIPSLQDEDGYYFIDRTGELFTPILNFFRTGLLVIPDHINPFLIINEAQFYSIDLSDAFCGNFVEGLYTSEGISSGQSILFIEKHPEKPWMMVLTGILLKKGRTREWVQFWRQCCPIKAGIIYADDFEIYVAQVEPLTLAVRQSSFLSSEDNLLSFECPMNDNDTNLDSDKWWTGLNLVEEKYIELCPVKIEEHKWTVMINHGDRYMLGPYDMTVLCSKFALVDGKKDSFWLYFPSIDKILTYDMLYGVNKETNLKFTNGWYRFRLK